MRARDNSDLYERAEMAGGVAGHAKIYPEHFALACYDRGTGTSQFLCQARPADIFPLREELLPAGLFLFLVIKAGESFCATSASRHGDSLCLPDDPYDPCFCLPDDPSLCHLCSEGGDTVDQDRLVDYGDNYRILRHEIF